MGNFTLDTLWQQVKFRMGQRNDLEQVGTDVLNYYEMWVNQAYTQICAADFLFGVPKKVIIPQLETSVTETTTASTPYITLPTSASIIRHVFDNTNHYRLRWIPEAKYVNYADRDNTSAYSNPTEWARLENKIYVHPTPNSDVSITVFYKQMPTLLTGEATTAIGGEWDEVIVSIATYKAMLWLGEYEKAEIVKGEIVDLLTAIIPPVHQEEKDRREWRRPDEAYILSWG